MSQAGFGHAEYVGRKSVNKRELFLVETEQVMPGASLPSTIEPYYPVARRGRSPYPLASMLRIHLMQNWFWLSDSRIEEAVYEVASKCQFVRLSLLEVILDETTVLSFRDLLEKHELAVGVLARANTRLNRKGLYVKCGTMVNVAIICAGIDRECERRARARDEPNQEGYQWYFGMKATSGRTRIRGWCVRCRPRLSVVIQ